jgi:hypothetical protein
LKCWNTLLFTWSGHFWVQFVSKLEKKSEVNEIFKHWGCHVLFCSPTFRILTGWLKEAGTVSKRHVELRQEILNKMSVWNL